MHVRCATLPGSRDYEDFTVRMLKDGVTMPGTSGITREIQHHGYLIKCGNRAWIFDGPASMVKYAVENIRNDPRNAGSRVTYKKIM